MQVAIGLTFWLNVCKKFLLIISGSPQPKEVSIFTKDYVDILEAITESGFYTEDPEEACIFVPPFNLLNEAILDPISSSKGWWKFLFFKTSPVLNIVPWIPLANMKYPEEFLNDTCNKILIYGRLCLGQSKVETYYLRTIFSPNN